MAMAIRRIFVAALGFVLQMGFYISLLLYFSDHLSVVAIIYRLLGLLIVLNIIRKDENLNLNMIWIVLILVFPIWGTVLYITLSGSLFRSKTLKNINKSTQEAKPYYQQDSDIIKEVEAKDYDQMRYLYAYNNFPIYKYNDVTYYPFGQDVYEDMISALNQAEEFIFIEYFIIRRGKFWNSILDILKEKAKQGVDVRVMYDDIGCVSMLEKNYYKKLEADHIKCVVFNRLNPIAGVIMNNRDHRKLMIIDGKIGFSGGINLSDEYLNINPPYGVWKDNAIRIKGSALWSMTLFFLTNWNAYRHEDPDFNRFHAQTMNYPSAGYLIPYCDAPLDDRNVGEDVYMNILSQASHYVYIMTPYLIIDAEMIKALTLAANRGVDVRIIAPGIPDKKLIYMCTTSYFHKLMENGVKMYTYTPGFVHAKIFVSDDHIATVGTINLDYRSLVHHFENGFFMEDMDVIKDVKKDFINTMKESHLVTNEEIKGKPLRDLWEAMLRIFSPLL